jgi:hypothetical protein
MQYNVNDIVQQRSKQDETQDYCYRIISIDDATRGVQYCTLELVGHNAEYFKRTCWIVPVKNLYKVTANMAHIVKK